MSMKKKKKGKCPDGDDSIQVISTVNTKIGQKQG